MRTKCRTDTIFALSLLHNFLKLQNGMKASSPVRKMISVPLKSIEICEQAPGRFV